MCDCNNIAASSDLRASVTETPASKNAAGPGFAVKGNESLSYTYSFVDSVFDTNKEDLSEFYTKWGRVLVILDTQVNKFYGDAITKYFEHYNIKPTLHVFNGGELNKNMKTFESFVDAMDDFGLIRKEPVLVVGGGLATDVVGYVCASYRRSSNFIRVATTLIGLIDAAVSIKVGINHKKLKNRLGAYHAPMHTFLDFDFLKTLPIGQIRNGFAEIVKISHVAHKPTWDRMVKYGPELVETAFGRNATGERAEELREVAGRICQDAIRVMLDLETGNLHEIKLDRVIASGHTWSPILELTPVVPLRHGHAIATDMSYSMTLSLSRGYINEAEWKEFHDLLTTVGLTVDHEDFTEPLLKKATEYILKTRDNKQWFAVAKPIGTCHFINDASDEELAAVLRQHKALIKEKYPQTDGGRGKDAFVDASDMGLDMATFRKLAEGSIESAKVSTGVVKAEKVANVNGHQVVAPISPASSVESL
nr:TPA_exp: desmethyl-4-deoxygadusol synthase [Phaffia brasiliana]DBA07227.1 TPA_exp: Desmethyl-4-deoxygadusol synthase [Phaffia brasiliana]